MNGGGESVAAFDTTLARWLPDEGSAGAADAPPWLEQARARARTLARAAGVPARQAEGWRYTGVSALLEQGFAHGAEAPTIARLEDLDRYLIRGLDAHLAVLVNGRLDARLSRLSDLPRGMRVGGLRDLLAADGDALEPILTRIAEDERGVFTALNTATLDDGLALFLDRGVALDRPLEILHLAIGVNGPRVAHPRHVIQLGAGSQAQLIERYIGLDDAPYCTNAVLEIDLGRDAVLEHRRIQQESGGAFHLSGLYLSQRDNSRYFGVNIGLGGAWARTDLVVRLAGEHAECELRGLYLAGDGQLIDYHMDVRHARPNCASRENFKGILYGKGKAVFDGRVHVAPDAQKTDAAMANNNLILSPNAEIDTKPQLEIHADDVKCSHGTTVGQIEPEMLFYLRSRGIAASLARRMLCLGFASEIVDALSPVALRDHVAEQVGKQLEQAPLDGDPTPVPGA